MWPGANADIRDTDNRAPLLAASELGNVTVVRKLLQRAVDLDIDTVRGEAPLGQAIRRGHIKVVRLFLAARAKTPNLPDARGSTLLHHAIM